MKQKIFEITIKTTIVYHTFDFADSFDFECGTPEIIEDLFKDAKIEIKHGEDGIIELEILSVKEKLKQKKRGGCDPSQ